MKTFTRTIMIIVSAIALTAGSAPSVNAEEKDYIKYRQAIMKMNGGQISAAFAILKGKVPYEEDLVTFAMGLDQTAKVLPNAFKTKTSGGKTRAKPGIWENPEDFSQKISDFQKATADFLAAARSGGIEAARAKAGALGDACTACHKKYRAKKS